MKDVKSCIHDNNEESIVEKNSIFANEAAAIGSYKFDDTEKVIISINKLEDLLDEIENLFNSN